MSPSLAAQTCGARGGTLGSAPASPAPKIKHRHEHTDPAQEHPLSAHHCTYRYHPGRGEFALRHHGDLPTHSGDPSLHRHELNHGWHHRHGAHGDVRGLGIRAPPYQGTLHAQRDDAPRARTYRRGPAAARRLSQRVAIARRLTHRAVCHRHPQRDHAACRARILPASRAQHVAHLHDVESDHARRSTHCRRAHDGLGGEHGPARLADFAWLLGCARRHRGSELDVSAHPPRPEPHQHRARAQLPSAGVAHHHRRRLGLHVRLQFARGLHDDDVHPADLHRRGPNRAVWGEYARHLQRTGHSCHDRRPWLAGRLANVFPVVIMSAVFFSAALLGLAFAPLAAPWLWVTLAAVGTVIFPMGMVLVNIRARTLEGATALTSFGQGVGYTFASLGPLLTGAAHEATDSFFIPLTVMAAIGLVTLVAGYFASRQTYVEDQLPA